MQSRSRPLEGEISTVDQRWLFGLLLAHVTFAGVILRE
jgi:hypothetical protein